MKLKILLVDDASFIRDLIKRTLRQFLPQCEVVEASDGKRAQAILAKQSVDLVLSDWEMPLMSGEELLIWLRGHEKHSKIPFIMISSLGGKEHIMKAVSSGVSDYLGKPFTSEELIQKVHKQLVRTGKMSTASQAPGKGGGAFSSIEIFSRPDAPLSTSADALTAGPRTARPAADAGARLKGTGIIRFGAGHLKCMIKGIDAEEMTVVARRAEAAPGVFEEVQVDITPSNDGSRALSLDAYVHSIGAIEKRPDAEFITLLIRFQPESDAVRSQLQQLVTEVNNG